MAVTSSNPSAAIGTPGNNAGWMLAKDLHYNTNTSNTPITLEQQLNAINAAQGTQPYAAPSYSAGLVPAWNGQLAQPALGNKVYYYLRGDGIWVVPPDTTYVPMGDTTLPWTYGIPALVPSSAARSRARARPLALSERRAVFIVGPSLY